MMIRKRKRLWAFLLSAALMMTQLPSVAMAENKAPEDGSIASFEPLDKDVAKQTVAVGTERSELMLPDTVAVAIYHVTENTEIPDEDDTEEEDSDADIATSNEADKSIAGNRFNGGGGRNVSRKDGGTSATTVTTSQEDIPVTWDSEPAYDGGTEGIYRFTADVDGYVMSKGAKPPQIMVTVTLSTDTVEHPVEGQPEAPILCTKTQGCTLQDGHEGQCVTEQLPANDALVKAITGWKFVATDYSDYIGNELAIPNVSMEHQADFAMVVSMLPTQISAVIDGEQTPETLDIARWDCPEYAKTEEGNWPVSGEYAFTAALQPGYSCDPLPAVRVLIGGVDLLSDATWDGQSSQKASDLTPKVNPGDTITITGSSTSGATLTIDVDNITVTSDGNSVNGVSIRVESGVDSLTIKDLDLTPKDKRGNDGIIFESTSTLKAEGSCTIYGPSFDDALQAVIYSEGDLNLKVADNAELKLIGDQKPTERGNHGIRTLGSLIVDVGSGGSLTVESTQGRQNTGSAIYSGKSLTINNNGTVLATVIDQSGASSGAMQGINALGSTILSGSGTTTARGKIGLSVTGDLTVDGHVLAEGTSVGVALEKTSGQFCKLTGSGELTAKSIGDGNNWEMGYGIWVIYAGLDMAFEGKLTVHGGIGGRGCGIYVSGPVVIRKTPEELEVQKGTGTFAFASADGSLTNHTDMNILLNIDTPIAWPDIVPPSVLRVAPDGPYAGTNGRVDIIFSETIKDGPGTVTLTGGGDSITLTGGYWDVPYWEYTGKSWFIIDYAGLKNSTTYTVNISGFQDKAGNVMAADSSHTFTTIQGGGNTYIPSSGGGGGGGGGSSIVSQPKNNYTVAGDRIHLSLSRSDIQQLSDSGNSLIIQSNTVKMTFNSNALRAILDASSGLGDSITFTAEPADLSALPAAAGFIGARPAYDFAVSCKDAGGSEIKIKVDFPPGSASVAMNYNPEAGETTGSLFMVYADESGSVTWLPKSCYNSGKILADIPHFSVYGVGYNTQVPAFSDTQGHWAKEDIEFASARKLLTGTEHGLFSPDSAVTRGTLAAALGRLAGVNPESYQTRSFRDVRPDAFYAPYIEWAAQNNLVNPTEDNLFNPDAPVTREHLAVIIWNYAGLTGYSIPSPLHETPFADSDAISQWAADQIKSMQMAGIMKGKEGNCFEPQANATRAESSALLRRFVELAMDPSTAQGWKRNDSGYWLFYRDGKALTGWQSVDDKEYYFEPDGTWVPEAEKET